MGDFWFARRFPVGSSRNAMSPVNWKGYAATLVYVFALLGGGFAFAWLGATGKMIAGVTIFAVTAALSLVVFLRIVSAKGDNQRTVADYRKADPRV